MIKRTTLSVRKKINRIEEIFRSTSNLFRSIYARKVKREKRSPKIENIARPLRVRGLKRKSFIDVINRDIPKRDIKIFSFNLHFVLSI